jgi:hypothetical protein
MSLLMAAATVHGVFGWKDLVVVAAVLAGMFLAGLYGDVVVGTVIFGIAAVLETAAGLTARAFRSLRPSHRRRSRALPGRRAASVGGRLR